VDHDQLIIGDIYNPILNPWPTTARTDLNRSETGTRRWITQWTTHAAAIITGSPVFLRWRHLRGVSSERNSGRPTYPCCTFRRQRVAVDAKGPVPCCLETSTCRTTAVSLADTAAARYGNHPRFDPSAVCSTSVPATTTPSPPLWQRVKNATPRRSARRVTTTSDLLFVGFKEPGGSMGEGPARPLTPLTTHV